MPRKPLDFAAVQEIALGLPEVENGTSYGEPALKLRGKLFAGLAINKSAEPNTLGVRVSFEDRDRLIRAEPDVYYTTEHYVNYPGVLVRLAKIRRDDLRELLGLGWRYVMERTPKLSSAKPRKLRARPRVR